MNSIKRFTREFLGKVGMSANDEIRLSEKRRLCQLHQSAQNNKKDSSPPPSDNQDNSLKGLMPETRVNRTRSLTHVLTGYWNMQPSAKVSDREYIPTEIRFDARSRSKQPPDQLSEVDLNLQDISPFVKVKEQEKVIRQLYLREAEEKTNKESENLQDYYDLDQTDLEAEYFPDVSLDEAVQAKPNSLNYSEVEKLYNGPQSKDEASLPVECSEDQIDGESEIFESLKREIKELEEESEAREITLSLAETILDYELSSMEINTLPWSMSMEESEQNIDQVLECADWRKVLRIAENACTPPRVLEKLGGYPDVEVKIALADNSSTPEDVLALLSKDSDLDVRYALAENHNLPRSVLELLSADENPYVSSRALKTIERLACGAVFQSEFGSDSGNRGIRLA